MIIIIIIIIIKKDKFNLPWARASRTGYNRTTEIKTLHLAWDADNTFAAKRHG